MTAAQRVASTQQKMVSALPVLAHDGEKQVVLPASEAWPRLQSLHQHALLESEKGDLTVPSPKSAKLVYAHSLGSALGQFATSHPALRDTMFHSLVDHVSSTGSMDGLESLYASGLNHTAATGGDLHDRAMRTAKAVGFPKVSGGGIKPVVLRSNQQGSAVPRGNSKTIKLPNPRTKIVSQLGGSVVTGIGGQVAGLPQAPGGVGDLGDIISGLGGGVFTGIGGGQSNGVVGYDGTIEIPGLGSFNTPGGGGQGGTGPDTLGGYLGPILGPLKGQAGGLQGGGTGGGVGGNTHGYGSDVSAFFQSGGPKGPGQSSFGNQHAGPSSDVGSVIQGGRRGGSNAVFQNIVGSSPAAGRGNPLDTATQFGPHGGGHVLNPLGPGGGGDGGGAEETDPPDKKKDPAPVDDETRRREDRLAGVESEEEEAEEDAAKNDSEHKGDSKQVHMEKGGVVGGIGGGIVGLVFGGLDGLVVGAALGLLGGALVGAIDYNNHHEPADDGTGGGGSGPMGPKSSGYIPSDQSGSPVGPHSRQARNNNGFVADQGGNEITPAPDDPRKGGPRSFVAEAGFDNNLTPNPEDMHSPVTPHS